MLRFRHAALLQLALALSMAMPAEGNRVRRRRLILHGAMGSGATQVTLQRVSPKARLARHNTKPRKPNSPANPTAKHTPRLAKLTKTAAQKPAQKSARSKLMTFNAKAGRRRGWWADLRLRLSNPIAAWAGRIQAEVYLTDSQGQRLIDPVTGEARRFDYGIFKHGWFRLRPGAVKLYEVTGPYTDKVAQEAKAERIMQGNRVVYAKTKSGRIVRVQKGFRLFGARVFGPERMNVWTLFDGWRFWIRGEEPVDW